MGEPQRHTQRAKRARHGTAAGSVSVKGIDEEKPPAVGQ
jgi:hypothetical protein